MNHIIEFQESRRHSSGKDGFASNCLNDGEQANGPNIYKCKQLYIIN